MKTPLRHLYRTTFWSVSMINWTKVTFINWMKKMVLGLVCIYLYMDILIATINLIAENMTNVQLWVSLLVASYFGGVYRLHIYEYLHISRHSCFPLKHPPRVIQSQLDGVKHRCEHELVLESASFDFTKCWLWVSSLKPSPYQSFTSVYDSTFLILLLLDFVYVQLAPYKSLCKLLL